MRCIPSPVLALVLAVAVAPVAAIPRTAHAVSLHQHSHSTPYPGVTIRQYRTASPTTNAWAVFTDLCQAGVHIQATPTPTAFQATGDFGQAAGVQVATNGDFFKADPLRVYGNAVGDGVPWPAVNTGRDPAYAGEWYARHAGWFAFGPDFVEFNHTRQTKLHDAAAVGGWSPGVYTDTAPADAISLVGGFPELVVEGRVMECVNATDAGCFPDRSDMRARHPRTAMGLTEDRQTFILLVVDGRTADSAGMYGLELAQTMAQLGAWEAFNLDGGGSSQLWVQGQGYLNDRVGNNNGTGTRAVADHWGIRSGNGAQDRAGHCVSAPPCQRLPREGGVLDDGGACFQALGPDRWWRTEAQGEGGHLHWTNASARDVSMNSALWEIDLAEAGHYRVEFKGSAQFGVFARAHYQVLAGGVAHEEIVAQGAADGWHALGEYHFAAGGRQHVHVYDDSGANPGQNQHIVADAIRLTRIEAPAPDPDAGAPPAGDAATPLEPDASATPQPDPDANVLQGDPDAGALPDGKAAGDAVWGGDGPPGSDGRTADESVPRGRDALAADAAQYAGDGLPLSEGADANATPRAAELSGGCACRQSTGAGAIPWLGLCAAVVLRRRRPSEARR